MFDCLVLCKPIITYIWLSVCLISIKQSLLFFYTGSFESLLTFSLVVWLFDSWQTMYNVNVYDWKQTCLHLAFRFITFVMHFIFTIFFVRPQPCMLEFGREFFRWLDRESVWGWRTMPSNVHSVGLSLRRFAKIIIHGENLHFSFNNLFYNLFDDWNKDPWFFVSLYSWMFPNSFILVLLDFVWYCYHQLSAISLSFLIWSMYVTFGEVCFLLMLIEWSREVGISVWNFYQLYFSL